MRKAIYPGSFDPVTTGHIDVIQRATRLYDQIVIGVAKTPPKKPFFSLEERVDFLVSSFVNQDKVLVETLEGLAVEFAKKHQAEIIIRGLRAVSDFEHEFQMAQLNRKLDPDIETVFIMASPNSAYLSSSIVKEIAQYKGSVKGLVPPKVEEGLKKKFGFSYS